MKYIVLGTYTDKGLAGFVQNPNEDRGAAASKMIEAAGGKLLDMHLVRGQYDFVMVSQAETFEAVAACALKAKAAGTLSEAITLESVDLSVVREMGNKVDFSAPTSWIISTLEKIECFYFFSKSHSLSWANK